MKQHLLHWTAVFFVFFSFFSSFASENPPENFEESHGPENWIIETFECTGNEITSCALIKNEIYLNVGDKVDEEELENARLRLKSMGLFYEVQISLSKGKFRNQVVVVVDVKERSASYVHLNGNFYRDSLGSTTLGVGHRNLIGLGKQLEATVSKGFPGNVTGGSLLYRDPNLFGSSKYFGSIQFNTERISTNGIDDGRTDSLDLTLGRRLFDFSYIQLGLNRSWHSENISGEKVSQTDDNTTLEYGWNTQDDVYFPTSGTQFAIGTSYSTDFKKYYQTFDYVRPLWGNYYFGLNETIQHVDFENSGSNPTNLILMPTLNRYFSFHKAGATIPDRMKIYAGPVMVASRQSQQATVWGRTGLSYMMDSFGKVDFNLNLMGL